jgi:hypothetical protein
VCDALCKGLKKLFEEAIRGLKKSFEEMDKQEASNQAAGKFQVFKMSVGSADNFHGGLTQRIGQSLVLWRYFCEMCHTVRY